MQLSPAGGYILTGPDGTRAVFNAPTDPDFCGYLDPTNGITGLLDSAQVRESFVNTVEGDGATQGNQYFSRRVGTLQFSIVNWGSMAQEQQIESKIKRASRGMRRTGPCTLTWTPDGGATRMMFLYRQDAMQITGRVPKSVVLPMSSPYSYIYSAALHQQQIPFNLGVGDLGFSSPITSPFSTVYNPSSSQNYINNAGDAETWPLFTINGPMFNPELINNSYDKSWTLDAYIYQGQQYVIDTFLRTVTLQTPLELGTDIVNGILNPSFEYDSPGNVSSWWIPNGAISLNSVQLGWSNDGVQSQRITATIGAGSGAGLTSPVAPITNAIPVQPLTFYSASAVYNMLLMTSTVRATLEIQWYTALGAPIGSPVNVDTGANQGTPGIYPLSIEGTLSPSNAAWASVYLLVYNDDTISHTVDFYIDSISFAAGSVALYASGDSSGYTWTSTPGHSTTVAVLSYLQQDMYSAYAANFGINEWWSLQPGQNDVRLQAGSAAYPASVTVQWRDSFE